MWRLYDFVTYIKSVSINNWQPPRLIWKNDFITWLKNKQLSAVKFLRIIQLFAWINGVYPCATIVRSLELNAFGEIAILSCDIHFWIKLLFSLSFFLLLRHFNLAPPWDLVIENRSTYFRTWSKFGLRSRLTGRLSIGSFREAALK